ncbi:type II secretion system protein [Dehalogenimonas sp. 4OHTPN]|uniref:Type II secretion system protein n=1 Tax=Dehalogenimonas sp. 4OHTPN TaxID=3166643 RepID=A0AAU8GDU9_9CHLR
MRIRSQQGFTLIELLVVISILAAMTVIAVPNVLKFVGEGTDEAKAAELHNVTVAVTAALSSSTSTPPTCFTYSDEGIPSNPSAADNDPAKFLLSPTVYSYTITSSGGITQGDKYTWP